MYVTFALQFTNHTEEARVQQLAPLARGHAAPDHQILLSGFVFQGDWMTPLLERGRWRQITRPASGAALQVDSVPAYGVHGELSIVYHNRRFS